MKGLKKFASKFGALFDPLLLGGILLLFLVPAITLFSLVPGKQPHIQSEENVLGTTDQTNITISPNTSPRDGISLLKFTQQAEQVYVLYIEHAPHDAGTDVSGLFTAQNGTDSEKKINVTPTFERVPPDAKISLVLETVKFVLHDTDGTIYLPSLYLEPGKTMEVGIEIESETKVNFTSGFSLDVTVE